MEQLNYHHLHYFWVAANEGSITRAGEKLGLAQPTISAQVRSLEKRIGAPLFRRTGRRLVLTETGRVVHQYAEQIFALGGELQDTLANRAHGGPRRLRVGVADAVPKLVATRLIRPAFDVEHDVHLVCNEDKAESLAGLLASYALDVVLTDAPMGIDLPVKAFSHEIVSCPIAFFATPEVAAGLEGVFPACLEGARLLVPTANTTMRRSVDQWLYEHEIRPAIVAEVEDSGMLKAFGQEGLGVFPAPAMISDVIERQYDVQCLGEVSDLIERFFAITVERRIENPLVQAICSSAASVANSAAATA
ncbi:MAG: LysR family transcriptional regulator [Phycisphaerales bacterium]